jgi:hypothetical protein
MTGARASVFLTCVAVLASSPSHALLKERITTTTYTLPVALEPSISSFHLWTQHSLGPRLYHEALPDGRTMLGWTDASMNGHVSILGSTVQATFDFPTEPVRGMVAHSDGSFAVLLLNRAGSGYADDFMRLSKRSASGVQVWTATLSTADYTPNPALFNIGDSRLAYAAGVYGAYFSVHSSGGHEGDRYQRVSDTGAILSGGWGWGLSHSMSGVIAGHPENGTLHTVGSSDCYPSKALLFDKNTSLFAADADCAGKVSVQLGQMAAARGAAWLVAMDGVDRPGFPARGVGVVRVRPGGTPTLVWLTSTDGSNERDPVIARIGTSLGSNRFLVGWRQLSDGSARVAVMDTSLRVLSGPEVVTPAVTWGARDDSYRTRPDGSISWVEGASGSRTLRLHRYAESTNVAVDDPPAAASTAVALLPAVPNPFRSDATLRFRIERAGRVVLRIHDGAGRLVRTVLDEAREAGVHDVQWDGRANGGRLAPSGTYFATLETSGDRASTRLVLLR